MDSPIIKYEKTWAEFVKEGLNKPGTWIIISKMEEVTTYDYPIPNFIEIYCQMSGLPKEKLTEGEETLIWKVRNKWLNNHQIKTMQRRDYTYILGNLSVKGNIFEVTSYKEDSFLQDNDIVICYSKLL
jgi:hypothetical protein